jgi:hypothetical protein
MKDLGWCSWYSNWLQAGRPRGRRSSPVRGRIFLLSMSSEQVLGPTQPLIQWVSWLVSPGSKVVGAEAGHSPPTTAEVKNMLIYTSTTLPFFFFLRGGGGVQKIMDSQRILETMNTRCLGFVKHLTSVLVTYCSAVQSS